MFSVIESIATTAPLACVWCCARFKGFSQLIGINTRATYVKKAVAVSMRGPVTDQRSSLHYWELVLQPCTPKERSGIRIKQTKFVPWVPPLFFFNLNFYFKFILGLQRSCKGCNEFFCLLFTQSLWMLPFCHVCFPSPVNWTTSTRLSGTLCQIQSLKPISHLHCIVIRDLI